MLSVFSLFSVALQHNLFQKRLSLLDCFFAGIPSLQNGYSRLQNSSGFYNKLRITSTVLYVLKAKDLQQLLYFPECYLGDILTLSYSLEGSPAL